MPTLCHNCQAPANGASTNDMICGLGGNDTINTMDGVKGND
jgi:hypothetical protein